MRKRCWVGLFVVAALGWAACEAGVAGVPSLLGGTGLVALPNVWVVHQGDVELGLAAQSLDESTDTSPDMWMATGGSGHTWSAQAVGGVARNTEVWVDGARDNTRFENQTWSFGGKYQMPVSGSHYCIAVGAARRELSGSANLLNDVLEREHDDQSLSTTDLYVVTTTDFRLSEGSEWPSCSRFLGSFGLMYKRGSASESWAGPDDRGSWSGGDSLFEPFLGVEIPDQNNNVRLDVEYRWPDNTLEAEGVFSALVQYDFSPTVGVQLGTTNADPLGFGSGERSWFVNVGYTFSYGR